MTRRKLRDILVIRPGVRVGKSDGRIPLHDSRQALEITFQLVSDKVDIFKNILVGEFTRG